MNNINIKGLKINNTQEVDSILGSIVGSGESNAIPTTQAVHNLVSSEMSIEVSNRQIVDMSLSTALSSEISSTNSDVISLSTAVSTRISVDVSLSTAINTKLSVSGGTVSSSFYLNGLLNNATYNYVLYYNDVTSGITYGVKSSGGGTPGGSYDDIQFNNNGSFSGTSEIQIIESYGTIYDYYLKTGALLIGELGNGVVVDTTLHGIGLREDGVSYHKIKLSMNSDPSEFSSGMKIGDDLIVGNKLYVTGLTSSTQSNILYYNTTTKEITYGLPSGGGTTPGGSDTYVQFNDGGTTFGGHSGLTYSKITGNLTSSGLIKGSNIETNPTSLSVKIGIEAGKSEDQSASRRNIYIGFQSGQLATNGATDCVSIGYQSLFNNTTGDYNISIGTYASFTNGTGHSNVVLGYNAAFNNTSGSYSVYIGRASGEGVSTGSHNSCVGYGTGQYLGASTGNVLFGSYAGAYLNNTTGAANYNCFIGYQCASSSNINGDYNIGIGFSAFSLLTTGSYNIGIGNNCLTSVTTGTNNTSIGLYSGMGGNVSNSIYLGAHAGRYEGGSNKLFIDSLNRTDESTARTDSLIYGEFNLTANLQNIYFNATTYTKRLVKTYQTLTSSASITMNVRDGQNAIVVLGVSATLTLSNLIDGDEGNIIITQDATGGRTLTISPTPKVINGGGGVITLTGTANSTDMLSYTYSNSVLYITYGKNYS